MIVHFVCRGNAFRSILAEAYLNSLRLEDTSALSSGTVAAQDKDRNLDHYRMTLQLLDQHGIGEFAKAGYGEQLTQSLLDRVDVTVCLNQRVYDECLGRVRFPAAPRIWSVADLGEPGRISRDQAQRQAYREAVYQEITAHVDRLACTLHQPIYRTDPW